VGNSGFSASSADNFAVSGALAATIATRAHKRTPALA
jgi:hypothetical protein